MSSVPQPISVEIVPFSADWPGSARREIEQITRALGSLLSGVHHIGSTAVPGLAAKPILDLMPVAADILQMDGAAPLLEQLGYRGWGELGIPGRRYFTKETGAGVRVAQLHCFAQDSPHIERHLAFRDYLRAHPAIASAYQNEKLRCAALHSWDSHAYSDCKAAWIVRVEAEALCWYRSRGTEFRDPLSAHPPAENQMPG